MRMHRSRRGGVSFRMATLGAVAVLGLGAVACGDDEESSGGGGGGSAASSEEPVTVGLITKTETNPFFVKMKEAAQAAAKEDNVELITAAGKSDTDNQSQVTALENMTTQGAKGILIVPADSKAVVPAIEKARAAGVTVIALDTPPEPQDAVDALFATDNKKAGDLIGQYAKAKAEENSIEPKIAMLDLAPGISVGQLRHDGFLEGFGIKEGDPADRRRRGHDRRDGQGSDGMETLLQKDPDINIVYSINEPSGFGGANALQGGRQEARRTSSSSPSTAAATRSSAASRPASSTRRRSSTRRTWPAGRRGDRQGGRGGKKPSGYVDTGVDADHRRPGEGVASKDVAFGTENCWG